jgi:hypothetical protein
MSKCKSKWESFKAWHPHQFCRKYATGGQCMTMFFVAGGAAAGHRLVVLAGGIR